MIISENNKPPIHEFEKLLYNSHKSISDSAESAPNYFLQRNANEFERDVYECLVDSAENTPFENSIELISGHKFPDIVVKKLYGVEVKTTRQNHWRSTGNSVLESTRIEDITTVYIFFARLIAPPRFKYRKYQDCLYDIAVTHSPRYLIDMDVNNEQNIFKKLGIEYDKLRNLENPVKKILEYYRGITKKGEEPWWMGDQEENIINPVVRFFGDLPGKTKTNLIIQAMALFPEIFGKSSAKYKRLSLWLASRHGIIASSLRDSFSAGGQVELQIDNSIHKAIPRIYKHLQEYYTEVLDFIIHADIDDLKYYWNVPEIDKKTIINKWIELVLLNASKSYPEGRRFLIHLFGYIYPDGIPDIVKEEYEGFSFE
jgi:hypothetical protein